MEPIDPYFTSAVQDKDRRWYNAENNARWKAFNMLSHEDQAKAIDRILEFRKQRRLNKSEYALLRRWEISHSPPKPV